MLIHTAAQIRVPLSLIRSTFAQSLHRHTFQRTEFPPSPEAIGSLYRQFFTAARDEAWKDLYSGRLRARFPDGEREITVDMRNPQFGAADTGSQEFKCGYEPEIGGLLDLLLPDDGVFVDAGSNWGYFPVYVLTRPGYRGRVHAFEPHPQNFSDLKSVVQGFQLESSIHCHRAALSNANGECFLSVPEEIYSGSTHMAEQGIPASMQTLDSMDLDRLDFLKIDVEGFEAAVIEGAAATLSRHRPTVIFEDWSGQPGSLRTFRLLHELDYILFWPCWQRSNGSLAQKPTEISQKERLVLLQFDDRGRLPSQVNLLACPRDRFQGPLREALNGRRA